MTKDCILVVCADNDERRRIAWWLEDAGYGDVMFCPGPDEPDYTCLGSRGFTCPLSTAADLVIVDMHLRSDEAKQGTPGWQLMLMYYEQGKRIIALSGAADYVHPKPDDQVVVISRPFDRASLIDAVRAQLHPARVWVKSANAG